MPVQLLCQLNYIPHLNRIKPQTHFNGSQSFCFFICYFHYEQHRLFCSEVGWIRQPGEHSLFSQWVLTNTDSELLRMETKKCIAILFFDENQCNQSRWQSWWIPSVQRCLGACLWTECLCHYGLGTNQEDRGTGINQDKLDVKEVGHSQHGLAEHEGRGVTWDTQDIKEEGSLGTHWGRGVTFDTLDSKENCSVTVLLMHALCNWFNYELTKMWMMIPLMSL